MDDAWIPWREKLAMADRQPHGSFLEARYDFRQRRQGEDETMDEYLTAIRTLAMDCNFGETLVERLLEQLTIPRGRTAT